MTQMTEGQMGAAVAGGMILLTVLAVAFAVCILMLIAEWKIFKKAGEHGWAVFVPFYNVYVLTKITWGNGWLFLLMLLPLGNFVFLIFTWIKLARVFGKGGGYAVGLIFLPVIFLPMLGFGGSAVYQGPDQGRNKGPIIACAVLGGLGVLLYGAIFIFSVTVGVTQIDNMSSPVYNGDYDDLYEDIYDDYDDYDDYDSYDDSDDFDADAETTPIEGYNYFVNVILDNDEVQISVPILNSEYLSASGGSAASVLDGVSTTVYIGYAYAEIPQMVSESVESTCDYMEEMPEYYADITVDEMIAGDGFALQQINYNYISWDGDKMPCIEIIKCDQVDDSVVMMDITVDNSIATENTQDIFREACELYGIDFEFD